MNLIRRHDFDLPRPRSDASWISGFGVLEEMHAQRPDAQGIPVIVITGMNVQPTEFEKYGPVAILHKPFDPDRLLGTVTRLLYGGGVPV